MASQKPYAQRGNNELVDSAPWGTNSWAVGAVAISLNGTRSVVDEFALNVSSGVGHAWVREDRRVIDARTGVAGFAQGLGIGLSPPQIPVVGRDTILAYRIMRENTSISSSLFSIDLAGILFDLILMTDPYLVNGSVIKSFLVVDFYVHQECGALNGGCSVTNNTSVDHRMERHTHFISWRIHENLREGEWISDVVNLRWYLERSVQRAYCRELTGKEDCSLQAPQAYLFGLTATAEAFGGSAGFALDYEYLLQSNDCEMGIDAGNNFDHPLHIDNLNPSNVTHARWLQLDGWLGNGSLYDDSDDYYQFEVTPAFQETGFQLHILSEGSVLTELYAPGERPVLKSKADGVQTDELPYIFTESDSLGNWYLHIRRSSGFGPYSLLFKGSPNSEAISMANPTLAEAKCSALPPATEIPWQLIIPLTALTVLILFGGRSVSRRRPASS